MRLIILFLMFVFSCFSCSLRKKSSVEVAERKMETLKEEQKGEVQSVSNASTFVDSSKIVVYNDAVKELVETYKYTPPDSTGAIYIKEYTRTTRDKQSNAKQMSNVSAQSQTQDSVSVNSANIKKTYSDTETKTRTKEQVNNKLHFYLLVAVIISIFSVLILLRKKIKRFWGLFN